MTFDALPATASFPGTPLDERIEVNLSGTWTDISAKVYTRDQLTITRGHPDESTTTTASQLTCTLNNRDGRFSSLNPLGPYYGSLGRNTPVRVSFPEGASYLRLENDGANAASSYASGAAAINPAGDIDIQIDVTLDNWNAGQILAGKWAETGNERAWLLLMNDTGSLTFVTSTSGSAATGTAFSQVALPLPPLLRQCIRVTYAHSTGQVTFYTAPAGTLASPTWTQADQLTIATGTLFASTTTVQVGWVADAASQTGSTPGMLGKVHAFVIRAGIGGSTSTSPDFTQQTAGVTSFNDGQSITWTLHGTSEISNRKYRFHGEVAAWPQAWNPNATDIYIQIASGGLLRRLSQRNNPVNSALYRASVRLTGSLVPVAYWPGEDLAGATQIASGIGGPAMTISGTPQLASFSDFACTAPIPVLNGATFTGQVPAYTGGTGNVLRFLMAVPSGGDTNGGILARVATTGTVRYMTLVYGTGGTLNLTGYDQAGAQLFTSGATAFNVNGALVYVAVSLQTSGSNLTWEIQTVVPGAADAGTATGTVTSASIGNVTSVLVNPKGTLTGTAAGQWMVQPESGTGFFADVSGPLLAWAGETAGNRFSRLCTEEGIAFRGRGRLADTVPMGDQTLETLTSLLQECCDADRGVWTEPRQCLGWGYRTRVALGNQTPAVTLNYAGQQITVITPTEDDQTTFNDVTVTNTDGSSSRQVLTAGALSIQAPPAGIGRYDTSVSVNVASDSQLDSEASWILHAATVNESRYPELGVNLARSQLASVYYDLQDMDLGDRLVITNPPAWLPPGQIDQLLQGVSEVATYRTFTETWNGIPSSPWNTAYADDTVYGRADTDGSSLHANITSTATTMGADTAAGFPLWTTAAGDFPFDIAVAGERMTVTNITGTTSPQTFTVTRSVNGVAKAQTASADIRLFYPPIISL